jgi:hypothetical protein
MPHAVSATVVVQSWLPVLKTPAFAERHVWSCACRDPVLIGTLPTHGMAASRHAALYGMACLEQVARHRAFGSMPVSLSRMLHQTADCLLRTGGFPYAAGPQEEGERSFARRINHLTSLMGLILTRNYCPAQDPHATA